MSDEAIELARRIEAVLLSHITPNINTRKTQQLLRIHRIVDEIIRNEVNE